MREIALVKSVEWLEGAEALDPVVGKVRTAVNAIVRPQALRDVLHGVPIGHPMHPLLVLAGANHAEGIPSRFPQGWQPLGVLTSMPQNELITREVAGTRCLCVRLPTPDTVHGKRGAAI